MKQWKFWIGLMLGSAIVILFQHSLVFNLSKPLGLLHGDAYLVNFILKHWMWVVDSGQWQKLFTLPMFYGFSDSLFFTDHHLIQALMASPFFFATRNIILTSNILVICTLLLSFVSMYVFMWHMTKHAIASILASILFVLNPFVFARYPDQLILFSLQWIPLIFLSLERRRFGWMFVFLALQLLTSLYYSVFLTVILPFYIVLRRVSIEFNRSTVLGFMVFLIVTIFSGLAYYRVFSKEPIRRSMEVVETYAARPEDWFTTSQFNILYGGLPKREGSIYSEHSLFPGVVAITLLLASFWVIRIGSLRNVWTTGMILMIVSVILSFGPTIPGIYQFLYAINPLFSFIRTSARFAVFFYFFAAWIAGLTVARFFWPKAKILGVVLILFTLFEYWNKPLDFISIDAQTRQLYQLLEARQDIQVILEYPIGNLISYAYKEARAEDLDAHYLLYATLLHNKTLFNGYTGFLPAAYYSRANLLSVNFPTEAKLRQLQAWGVDAIVLHKDEFRDPSMYATVLEGLARRNVPKMRETESLALFDLTAWTEAP